MCGVAAGSFMQHSKTALQTDAALQLPVHVHF